MRAQKAVLKKQIDEDVASKIQNSINVKLVFDALSGIASSDLKVSLAKNVAIWAYKLHKSTTVVTDADGNTFEKIVNEIRAFEGTVESLQNDVKTNSDSTVALDDPRAMRILANRDLITQMMTQFKSLLPQRSRQRLSKNLSDYIETILKKNSAVLEYKATLQLVVEPRARIQAHKDALSALVPLKELKLDPELPAIVNFLRKPCDDFTLAIMRELDSCARAVQFWGLPADLPPRMHLLLRDIFAFEEAQEHLKTLFERCLEDYANAVWSSCPAMETVRGMICKIDETTLQAFKSPQIDPNSGNKVYNIPAFNTIFY